jgi:hypothetical protein
MGLVHRLACAAASLLALSLAGCGGTKGTGAGSSGGGGSGSSGSSASSGSTGSSGSSSGTVTTAAPDGAWVVNMTAGAGCTVAVNTRMLGQVDNQMVAQRVVDQMAVTGGTAHVQCTVAPAGAGFHVTGVATVGGNSLQINVPTIAMSASKASPAVGSIDYTSDATMTLYNSTMCDFFFDGNESIGAGKAWLSFTCAAVTNHTQPPSACPILESYVVFENCKTM